MIPRSFYFLRHGETDWNRDGRTQGSTDIPLNDKGRQQAEAAALILKNLTIDRIVSSPLSRARETAEIVNKLLGKPLHIDEKIAERNFGLFEGN